MSGNACSTKTTDLQCLCFQFLKIRRFDCWTYYIANRKIQDQSSSLFPIVPLDENKTQSFPSFGGSLFPITSQQVLLNSIQFIPYTCKEHKHNYKLMANSFELHRYSLFYCIHSTIIFITLQLQNQSLKKREKEKREEELKIKTNQRRRRKGNTAVRAVILAIAVMTIRERRRRNLKR